MKREKEEPLQGWQDEAAEFSESEAAVAKSLLPKFLAMKERLHKNG